VFNNAYLSTEQISTIFSQEIQMIGGTVHERFDDGSRLFVRSILPPVTEVKPGDGIKGGVAIRADDSEISVHPYTYRLVCTNGAIHAHATQSQQIILSDEISDFEAETHLRQAIHACAAPEAFRATTGEMRGAMDSEIDMLLTFAPMLARMSPESASAFIQHMSRIHGARQRGTRFDLANLVTAAAQRVRNPDEKWRMEELGGAIFAEKIPTEPRKPLSRAIGREEMLQT
jgi:hypothetical protein